MARPGLKSTVDAAKKGNIQRGDRYFSIVNKYNDEADKLLKGRGI